MVCVEVLGKGWKSRGPLPGGGHTAVLVMITRVPKLQAAAAAVRWTSAGPFKPLVPQLPARGGPGTAYSLPQSGKGSALHLFPRKQCGPQKEQSDLGLNFCSKSVSLPLIQGSVGDEVLSPKCRLAPPLSKCSVCQFAGQPGISSVPPPDSQAFFGHRKLPGAPRSSTPKPGPPMSLMELRAARLSCHFHPWQVSGSLG